MTSISIKIPKEYGYVLAAALGSYVVALWHGSLAGKYRKAAKTPYPAPYAFKTLSNISSSEDKNLAAETIKAQYLFNCAQRAHGQFNEHYPIALTGLLISGLQYPITAAILGFSWSVNRVLFANGYLNPAKENGSGRYVGMGYLISELGFMGLVLKMAYDMIMA